MAGWATHARKCNACKAEIAALRNRIDFNRQRAQELGELIERYETDIAAAERKRSEQEMQIQEADAVIARTNQLLETKENEVEQLTETLRAARTERAAKEDELQSLQLSLSKFESKIATFQNDLSGITARRDATAARISELSRAISEQTHHVEEARASLRRAQTAMESEQQTAEKLRQTLRDSEEQQRQHQSDLAHAEKEIGRVERVIAEKQARLEVLRQMTEEGEGLEKGSQAVLKGLNDPDRIKPAIAGALVANLNVDREFIPALEAAFGRAMHAVVLQKTALAAEIFQTLTENKSGQAALAIPEWSADLPSPPSSKLPKGALAWAIEKVDAPEALAPIVRRLLRDVVLVSDLATALELKERAGHLQYATLGGEFISAEGIIFGGSTIAANDSLLGRKAVLTGLSRECDSLEAERQTLIETRTRAQEQAEAALGAVEEARRSHETAQQNHSQASVQILSAERSVQDAEQKLTNLQAERKHAGAADPKRGRNNRPTGSGTEIAAENVRRRVGAKECRRASARKCTVAGRGSGREIERVATRRGDRTAAPRKFGQPSSADGGPGSGAG